jgi:hypothetical protein
LSVRLDLDAAPTVYSVEQVAPYAVQVDARLAAPGVVLVASDLTRLACRVKPLRNGDAALLQDFDDFFAGTASKRRMPFTWPLLWRRAAMCS